MLGGMFLVSVDFAVCIDDGVACFDHAGGEFGNSGPVFIGESKEGVARHLLMGGSHFTDEVFAPVPWHERVDRIEVEQHQEDVPK